MTSTGRPGHLALIILDGLGDRPHPTTGGVSPVEAAVTPHLDHLSQQGRLGRVMLLGPGIAPESDAGVLALLGYDPVTDSPGRGVLEAIGVGVPLVAGDIALRLNFCTTDGEGNLVDSRVGRSLTSGEARRLAEMLNRADLLRPEGIAAEVRSTIGHRGVLWLHPTDRRPLSPEISNADPFYEKVGGMGHAKKVDHPRILPVKPLDHTPEAARSAAAVNDFLSRAAPLLAGAEVNSRRAIAGQKLANAMIVRNAGALPSHPIPTFRERHGFTGAAVTEMPVERGIAQLLGLVDHYVGPMGEDRDAALKERARVTRAALGEQPFVYVHLKGPDEPGHDGNANLKQEIIEALDRSFFGPFLEGIDWSATRVVVTADHSTPCILKAHSDDPVPLILVGEGVDGGKVPVKFSENSAASGSLGTMRGLDVMPLLKTLRVPATSK